MKKLLVIGLVVFSAVLSYGQGAVTLANSAATAITNLPPGGFIGGPGAVRTNVTVGLYGSTLLGLPNDSSLTLIGAAGNTAAPGIFSLGTRNIGNPGDTVTLQVRAWTIGFATYEDALLAALGGNANIVLGSSPKWEQITGGGTNPSQPITGAGRLTAFTVSPVPEPSSIALGLLGLGAIALFRRKK